MTSLQELEILNLLIKFKPAGLYKNFRMFNILHNSSLQGMGEIQDIIQKYYDLSQVVVEDDLEEREFLLPDYDFASIIEEYRLQTEDDASREVSPQRTSISASKRDSTSSQSNQHSASVSASGKRKTRNTTNQPAKREKRKRATHK
jgi:hypothetical protein